MSSEQNRHITPQVAKCAVTGKTYPLSAMTLIKGRPVSAEGKKILQARREAKLASQKASADDLRPVATDPTHPTDPWKPQTSSKPPVPLQNQEPPVPSLLSRMGGHVFDLMLSLINTGSLVLILAVPCGVAFGLMRQKLTPTTITYWSQWISLLVLPAYGCWMHGRCGQTIGKMAFNMRLMRMDGRPVTLLTGFLRMVGFHGPLFLGLLLAPLYSNPTVIMGSFLAIALFYQIGNLVVMALDPRHHRGLHDYLAGTRVAQIRR